MNARRVTLAWTLLMVAAIPLQATTLFPVSDATLYSRAGVIVHGIVQSDRVVEGSLGYPETVTVIRPIEVVKGTLIGDLVLHQTGGTLPDGRGFTLYGRPEYVPGSEVVVFAIARSDGGHQTAEMMLGKFEVWQDAEGRLFAIPDLERGAHPGVHILHGPESIAASGIRPLDRFLDFLRSGAANAAGLTEKKKERMSRVMHDVGPRPFWGMINNTLVRWNNNATAVWTRSGTANMTGGGNTEAINALATWRNEPNSNINYTDGAGSTNLINLNAGTSPCGWNTCLPPSLGVVGCGGPSSSGTHSHRSETYQTAVGGTIWLRCYSTLNQLNSTVTQAILVHEAGHTLGLGHSDVNVSTHDVCRGDEGTAVMTAVSTGNPLLGTDDVDAVRWLYGDGLNSCSPTAQPFIASYSPTAGGAFAGGATITVTGNNLFGATVMVGGQPGVVTSSSPTQLVFTTPALPAGTLNNIVVTNIIGSTTISNGYLSNFADVQSSHPFHSFIEKIFRWGITGGCFAGAYCPDNPVTRTQMAIFLLRGIHGGNFVPPPATGTVFTDVPATMFGANFIERLAAEGITSGCAPGMYCPTSNVLRSQMAIFLLRSKHGSGYVPPPATGTVFTDVPAGAFAANFIEQLAAEGITGGCAPSLFCPNDPVNRAQMAVFLTRTFNLP